MKNSPHNAAFALAALLALCAPAPYNPAGAMTDPAFDAFQAGEYLTAIKEAEKAAAEGDPAAHTLLGEIYSKGLGTKRDQVKAAKWYEKGAELGDANAQLAFGLMLNEGRGVKQDKARAATLFEKAAQKGLASAQYNMALVLIEGRVRKANHKEAVAWLTKAADQDHAQALYDLSGIYASDTQNSGSGMEKAIKLLKRAADLGHDTAQLEYAIKQFNGKGVPKDEVAAVKLLKSSAEKGNPVAQNRLARVYANGAKGLAENPIEAAKWHLLARDAGASDFWLDAYITRLTPDQRAQAEKAAERWALNRLGG